MLERVAACERKAFRFQEEDLNMTELTTADLSHLRRAFELAREAGRAGNRPFGAVLVGRDGQILAEGQNAVRTGRDITAHAESAALRKVSPDQLLDATMFASGEPCAMCAAAMALGGLRRVIFGLSSPVIRERWPVPDPSLSLRCAEVLARASRPVEVVGPVLEEEAAAAFASAT